MNKKFNFKKINEKTTMCQRLFFLLFLSFFVSFTQAEEATTYLLAESKPQQGQRKVSGEVIDPTGVALPGVNVLEKGTTNGAITDIDGRFELTLQTDNPVLVFSYIGFAPSEIIVGNRTTLSVRLNEDITQMDEVVVIGYGSTTKKEITGSIASIREENFVKGNITDPLQLLQGQVAGMSIVKPDGGDPNGGFNVQLRGMTSLSGGASPLVVVDGVVGVGLGNISPEEIESIDVLKDGSAAAIYGTRGTNGVILVTTKQAKGMEKSTIEFSTYAAIQTVAKKLDVLNAQQFRQVINDYYPTMKDQYDFGASTDWFDEVTRSTPFSQYYNVSLSGGAKTLSYRASLSYQDDQGLVEKTSSNKLRAKMSVSQRNFNDKLSIDYNLSYSTGKSQLADKWILQQVARRNPTEPVYDVNNATPISGGYFYNSGPFEYYNPVAMIKESTRERESREMIGSMRASWEIVEGLRATGMGSYYQWGNNTGSYYGRYYPIDFGTNGSAEIDKDSWSSALFEANLDYRKTIAEHSLQAIAGYSFNEGTYESSWAQNILYDTDFFSYHNIGAGAGLSQGQAGLYSYKDKNRLIAFFGRIMYNFKEKYLLSASVRYEGSSRFGENNKWGTFPAISAGWRINKEQFMESVNWLNDLKLRVGYGITGNQEIGNYQSLQLLTRDNFFLYNGRWISTYRPASNPNPDLKWEKKGEFNIGLDFSTFHGRLGGAIDYYNRTTTDLLYWYSVPVPPNLYNQLFTNVGSVRNSGIELTLNTVPVTAKNFRWNSTLTLSHNENKLVKFSSDQYAMVQIRTGYMGTDLKTHLERIVEGGPIGNFWGPKFLGIDENGQNVFQDLDNNGLINDEDNQVLGNAYPDIIFGFSNTFTWKQWDLSFLLRGSIGNDVVNVPRMYYEGFNYFGGKNILTSTLEWPEYKGSSIYSDRFVEDASFLKLDNLTLGYNFKLNTQWISKLKLYFTAQNILTVTGYKGIDPEVNLSGLEPGIDYYEYYPRTRTFLLGLNINF
ncbi:MAG: TonB-dependent receptor [Tannerellaceae bacterium]|jgi:TonB-linked SusC/RagA family outer membrane protein|nr:TonB-dependent receptor [Tannerellaceae bacterium]